MAGNEGSNKPMTTLQDLASGELFDGGMTNVIEYWWSRKSIGIHTQIPAKITELHLNRNSVTVQPLIKTFVNGKEAFDYPPLVEVPLHIVSGNKGVAKLTMPIKVNDIGILTFSERDPANWLNTDGQTPIEPFLKENLSSGTAMYPIMFEVGIFTPSVAVTYDPVNIVLQNDKSFVILHPNGKIEVKNNTSSIVLDAGGNISVTSSSSVSVTTGSATVTSDSVEVTASTVSIAGATTINGATIGLGGNLVTANGTDLDTLQSDFDDHVHGGGTSASGRTTGVILP